MSSQASSSNTFSAPSTSSSQLLPTFEFDVPATSAFDVDFLDQSMEFDSALGFEAISPVIVPADKDLMNTNLDHWLDAIPVINPFAKEMEELAETANIRHPNVITLKSGINVEETIIHHIRGSARWLLNHGPAPRTADERKKDPRTAEMICYLIYLQVCFLGDASLSPWQYTFFTELDGLLDCYAICPLCRMYTGSWCNDIVTV